MPGRYVSIAWNCTCWCTNSGFSRTTPKLPCSRSHLEIISDSLFGLIEPEVAQHGYAWLDRDVRVGVSPDRATIIRKCIEAVLAETDGDEIELEVRVGERGDVMKAVKAFGALRAPEALG